MKQLQAFAAIVACLVMPALAIVPDQDDWTVATMAPDGSWGSATEPSGGQALAKAICNCKAMSGREIGFGAQSRAIRGGWVLADRCGDSQRLSTSSAGFPMRSFGGGGVTPDAGARCDRIADH